MFQRLLVLFLTGLSLIGCGNGSDQIHHESPLVDIDRPDVDRAIELELHPSAENVTNDVYITGVRLRDSNHKPIAGLDLQLECYIQHEGWPKSSNLSWFKDGQEIKSDDTGMRGQKSSILTILKLAESNNGSYTCTIRNEAGKGQAKDTFQVIAGKFPVVTLTGPTRPLVSSDWNQTLTCSVTGTPPVTTQWYLEDKKLENITGHDQTYIIAEPGPSDRGRYKCEATNDLGTGFDEYYVEVYYAPVGKPSVKGNISAIVANTTNIFTCNVETLEDRGNPEALRYTWVYNNETMVEEQGAQVDIYQSSINDVVQINCLSVNQYSGSQESPTADIRVEAPVYVESPPVPPGDGTEYIYKPLRNDTSFHFQYVISGTNVSTIKLYRNSPHIDVIKNNDFTESRTPKEGNYSFEQISAEEVDFQWNLKKSELDELNECAKLSYFNGLYTLTASGTAAGFLSEATTEFRIAAKFLPTWDGETTLYANTGEELEINCSICACPEPKGYNWNFNGGNLPSGVVTKNGGRTLQIETVENDHIGFYGCEVTQESKHFKFKVEVLPKGLSTGVIAAIAVGCIVVCAVIAGTIIVIFRRNKSSDGAIEKIGRTPTLKELNRQSPIPDRHQMRPPAEPPLQHPQDNYENVEDRCVAPPRTSSKRHKSDKRGSTRPKAEQDVTDDNIYEDLDQPEYVAMEGDPQDQGDYVNMEEGNQETAHVIKPKVPKRRF